MQSLPFFIAELRALGVRRIDLELEPASAVATLPEAEPEAPAEDKPEGSCAFPGCLLQREGLLGGAVAAKFCRAHALAEAGVKL
jgi:hypothetical protein